MRISRDIISTFKEWKDAPKRKPILLQGARQIGKTWAMETFGKESFEYCAKFDFDRQEELKSVFQNTKMPERIIKELALFCDVPIIAGKTLIIPVGKVRVVRMYPLSFKEFLRASDIHTYEYIEQLTAIEKLPEIILNKLKLEYRRYLVCGGMPDAACAMLENQGMENVDAILQDILDLYELDFAKYAEPREIPRIHAIWHSLPSQLAKENRKFVYKVVKPGARAKDYEDALLWLEDAGMIYRINNITRPLFPLSAYEDLSAFKLYACDCGLLRRLAKLPSSIIVSPTANYTEFKGAMAENAILQSLMPILRREVPFYWSPDSRAEIEFVIQWNDEIIPIEVKAENCVSGRSLSVYKEKYAPKHRIRFSFLNLQYNCGMLSCPSPMADWLPSLLERC